MSLSQLTLGIFKDEATLYDALDAALVLSTHPHPRARVRKWIYDRLRAAALVPAKIILSPPTPQALKNIPAVFVYTLNEEDPSRFDVSPLKYDRPLNLVLEAAIPQRDLPGGVSLDDVADAFAFAFEQMLLLDVDDKGLYFGKQVRSCEPGPTQHTLEASGELVFLSAITRWEVIYQSTPTRPATNKLETVHADYDVGPGPDQQLEAEDIVDIEQDD